MNEFIADTVLMIRPVQFGFNTETAASNSFQQNIGDGLFTNRQIQESALLEFDFFVNTLRNAGIVVIVFDDTVSPYTPDSIFPNNWLSTSRSKKLLTYPMASANRAMERRTDILSELQKRYSYTIDKTLESLETEQEYLEGTGSLVIDHKTKTAYAAISPRTSEKALQNYAALTGHKVVSFKALGPKGEEIYHTNVMMCIGDNYVVIGTDTIATPDRQRVLNELKNSGKTIIELSNEQVYHNFAGNMLQLQNIKGDKFLIMSTKAYYSLRPEQIEQIKELENKILAVPINIIEVVGGGSARCMLAEIFY